MKKLTFSYDDGVTQDIRFIELLNKYGLKATFNLNSGCFGSATRLIRDGREIDHIRNKAADIRAIYEGHEVAAHTLTHPLLPSIADDGEIVRQVEEDRLRLSELVGYEVVGFAYPGGGQNNDARVAGLIAERTGVRYARVVATTGDFTPYPDIYRFQGSCYHHVEWEKMWQMAEAFLALPADTDALFYIWGHSYEFDIYPERWEQMEEFCRLVSGRRDISYCTNRQALLGDD
ncbi:MAG: polysaccharide deacetylase family protein [Clostridia bacterium]|nr:polysaccharide deacetylase family protein [Clostridia bacterium]